MFLNKRNESSLVTCLYVFIAFFISRYFSLSISEGVFEKIYSITSIIISLILFAWFFVKNVIYAPVKKNSVVFMVVCFLLSLFLSTTIKGGSIYSLLAAFYPIIATGCFIACTSEDHPQELVKAYAIMNLFLLALNLFEGWIFRDNTYTYSTVYYLLGGQTQFGIFCAITWVTVCVYGKTTKKNNLVLQFAVLLLIILNAIMMKAATLYICTMLIGFFTLIQNLGKKVHPWLLILLYLIVFLCIVVFQVQFAFEDIIEEVFNKDATLTYRTEIWKVAIKQINESWFIGHGMQSDGNLFEINVVNPNGSIHNEIYSAHNGILQWTYYGGVLSMMFVLLAYILAFSKKRQDRKVSYFYLTGCMVVLTNWLVEAPSAYGLLLLIMFAFYSKRFNSERIVYIKQYKEDTLRYKFQSMINRRKV